MSDLSSGVVPTAVAAAIFIGSLLLLLIRPRRVPDWAAALAGGLAMVLFGLLSPAAALTQLRDAWNVFLFFLGLTVSSAVAERAGLFRAAAELAARTAHGSQRRLLVGLYVAGTVITAVLSNDATALLLTPVAFAVATRLGLDARPYAFACALVANAASFLLPVSNPANLLVLGAAPLPLGTFVVHLLLPSVVALAVTLAGLLLVFRRGLAEPYAEPTGRARVLDRRAAANLAGVAGLMAAYVVGSALGWPLGVVAVGGAVALMILDAWTAGWEPAKLASEVAWGLFPLFAGLLLLVGGAERARLFAPLVGALDAAQGRGGATVPAVVLGTAVAANALNNLPAALVAASALAGLPAGGPRAELVAGVLVGVDLGPNLTPVGALSTLLWLLLLRRRGVDISVVTYLRVGLLVTVPALLAAAGSLWLIATLRGQA